MTSVEQEGVQQKVLHAPLAGRRALVTGGSHGIGEAIVRRLVSDGADVVFTYTSSAARASDLANELSAAGASVIAVQADSGDGEAVSRAVQHTAEIFGGIDVLVNNAGVTYRATVEQYPLEQFDRLVAVNVRGVFVAIRAVVPHMRPGGRIITVGSVNEVRVPMSGIAVYSMTKAAVAGLTRGLARELGDRGITVNNVAVGPTDTDMNPDDGGDVSDLHRGLTAVARYGQPAEIAGAIAYLASPEAAFITGSSWFVDGGYTV
jgi:3-oxoacyl-[acyl-carrier protein] reductase